MLCKRCKENIGRSGEKYIIQALKEWAPPDKGAVMCKEKVLSFLMGNNSEIYELQKKIELLENKIIILEGKKKQEGD